MKPYLAILSARFRALLQYRAAAIAGCATQLFWGIIRVMIFSAFYRSATIQPRLSLRDTITYLWLCQALFVLTMLQPDADARAMIRDGTVAYEMLRPLDLYALWFSRAFAARVAPTILRAVPLVIVAGLFMGLRMPPTPFAALTFAVATAGAFLLATAISTLTTISLLYTISGEGLTRIMPTLAYTLSGLLIPLPLLPASARQIVNLLPFRGILDTPLRLYLGNVSSAEVLPLLANQVAWIVVLILCGRALLARATRRLVTQGG